MKIDPQYWEDAQEALNRIFDRCEEIDPQSGYDMLEDIQFVRGFIDKHKPQESEKISDYNMKMWEEIFAEEKRRESEG